MSAEKTCGPRVGVGLYSIAEASRLLGVDAATMRRRIEPREQSIQGYSEPSERSLSFLELMELHFVKAFRGHGISWPAIRQAMAAAAKKFHTPHPFCVKRFVKDGTSVFAGLLKEHGANNGGARIEEQKRDRFVLADVMRPLLKKLEYHGKDEVIRYWPREREGRIVLDPCRCFGKPIDAETGVPTSAIYDASTAANGQDAATVARWLGIPVSAVDAAVEFEQSLDK
jgi:uncharacterized protein (DUF433 family)